MEREQIIRMAREAGFDTDLPGFRDGSAIALKLAAAAFAAGAAAERNRIWNQEDWTEYERGIAAAAKAEEREACAKLCEEEGLLWGQRYAAAIRLRSSEH